MSSTPNTAARMTDSSAAAMSCRDPSSSSTTTRCGMVERRSVSNMSKTTSTATRTPATDGPIQHAHQSPSIQRAPARWGTDARLISLMTRKGFTKLTNGTNQQSTPQPGPVDTRSGAASRALVCTRYCQASHSTCVTVETRNETIWKTRNPAGPSISVPETTKVNVLPAWSRITIASAAAAATAAESKSAIVAARPSAIGSRCVAPGD